MAKMHFKYAAMNSGKSIDLIRTAHNYEENGYQVMVIKPIIDIKGGENISSRIGLQRKADLLILYSDRLLDKLKEKLKNISCILVDESQFLSTSQVDELIYNIKSLQYTSNMLWIKNKFQDGKLCRK